MTSTTSTLRPITIGLVGFGYWGPNLARNFTALKDCHLKWICELDPQRLDKAGGMFPVSKTTPAFKDLLNDKDVEAILIATPVSTHFQLAKAALEAGKHVMIEKPMTSSVEEAEELVELARRNGLVLAVDHTFLFTGAVQKIKQMVDDGSLGDLVYYDSVRVNLGLVQHDVNVMYDLGPHDLSILLHLQKQMPVSIQAMGSSYWNEKQENITYLHLEYTDGMTAHFHWNWLAPVKIRQVLLGGTSQMVVYDDMQPSEKVKVYNKGIDFHSTPENDRKYRVDYRIGDMLAPKISHGEALAVEADHFANCVRGIETPVSDGLLGLKVVRLLDAAQESLRKGSIRLSLDPNSI